MQIIRNVRVNQGDQVIISSSLALNEQPKNKKKTEKVYDTAGYKHYIAVMIYGRLCQLSGDPGDPGPIPISSL